MNCVILQPSYLPWRGYFHQIERADVFVFYDDVQYDRVGWRNRNRIGTSAGPQWLTVPVHAKGSHAGLTIADVKIAWDANEHWAKTHLARLRHAYARAPHFAAYVDLLSETFAVHDTYLVDLLVRTTRMLATALGISNTEFVRSSTLGVSGDRTTRLVNIVKEIGADRYISGPSAASYINEQHFRDAGIALEYMQYNYPPYEQLYDPFDDRLSVVDLLFMKGNKAADFIWRDPTDAAPSR